MAGFPEEVSTTLQDEELVGPTEKGKCSWQSEGQVEWRQAGGRGERGRQCVQDPAAGRSDQTGDRGPGMPDAIVTCQGD